jgi:hypothetical protein
VLDFSHSCSRFSSCLWTSSPGFVSRVQLFPPRAASLSFLPLDLAERAVSAEGFHNPARVVRRPVRFSSSRSRGVCPQSFSRPSRRCIWSPCGQPVRGIGRRLVLTPAASICWRVAVFGVSETVFSVSSGLGFSLLMFARRFSALGSRAISFLWLVLCDFDCA